MTKNANLEHLKRILVRVFRKRKRPAAGETALVEEPEEDRLGYPRLFPCDDPDCDGWVRMGPWVGCDTCPLVYRVCTTCEGLKIRQPCPDCWAGMQVDVASTRTRLLQTEHCGELHLS